MNIGIVGLPNVGKSTLFRALTKKQVDIANYPFCTISPNTGIVKVPDARLSLLATLSKSEKIVPAAVEFVDIAGLVKGASKGEGLGNQFLAAIREVDAICQVVRGFSDENVVHVAGASNPCSDIEVINLELIYADLSTIEKRLAALAAQMKSGADSSARARLAVYERIRVCLDSGDLLHTLDFTDEERVIARELHLLTLKPFVYVINCDEGKEPPASLREEIRSLVNNAPLLSLCAKYEAEIAELSPEELVELGLGKTGLDAVIRTAYETLSLITYFTTGPDETRAWTIRAGTKAQQAAGVIHTDFEKGFIRAETINWKQLVDCGGEAAAKEKGFVRLEGKEYVVADGDVMVFRFA